MAPQTSHKKSFKVAVPVLYVPENAGNFRLVVGGVTVHVQTIPRLWPLWWPQLWAHLLVVPVISYGSSYFHLQCSDSGTSGSSHAWDWNYPCTWLSSTPVWSTTQAGCCGPTDYTQHSKFHIAVLSAKCWSKQLKVTPVQEGRWKDLYSSKYWPIKSKDIFTAQTSNYRAQMQKEICSQNNFNVAWLHPKQLCCYSMELWRYARDLGYFELKTKVALWCDRLRGSLSKNNSKWKQHRSNDSEDDASGAKFSTKSRKKTKEWEKNEDIQSWLKSWNQCTTTIIQRCSIIWCEWLLEVCIRSWALILHQLIHCFESWW